MTVRRNAVVAGATGVVGKRLAEHLASTGEWDVVGIARHKPEAPLHFPLVQLDLTDTTDCRKKLAHLRDVKHIFYAGRYTHTTQPEPVDINVAMMTNLVEALDESSALEHVHVLQGSKWYGATAGAYRTPAREDDPRMASDHTFYYLQQDWLEACARRGGWTWSASRPHGICDRSTGIARSLSLLIAVYASILKAEGEPLYFPGTEGNYRGLYQCTDALLLAKSIAWMSTEPRCANQAFNVTNGEPIRWMNLWPAFARHFRMESGPVRPQRLGETMPAKKHVWERIARERGLVATPFEQLVLWPYGDFVFQPDWDVFSSTLKLRAFGFHEVVDTERMFLEIFDLYRREKVIPAA